jgi:hypothetical protein
MPRAIILPPLLKLVLALCSILILRVNNQVRPSRASDFSLGFVVSILLGIWILALRALKRKPVCAR